ncbi:GTPase-associated system all-helical protein GASH [Delftia acidovorans]|uniref:GTPase-associated system all-helical protein GASH n=1 Tax=Delftia acidovorans TaxID=80866 RepID=UPI003D0BA6AA
MTKHVFADYYAAEGLAPSGDLIKLREMATKRILEDISTERILQLAEVYFGVKNVDLDWFRDEYTKDDASFSLINNERETRVLAGALLNELIDYEYSVAILAIVAGHLNGRCPPSEGKNLVTKAEQVLGERCVKDRVPEVIETKISITINSKLEAEIAAMPADDLGALVSTLGKMRAESQSSQRNIANNASSIIFKVCSQISLMREESQMLWWIFGGYSRTLEIPFSNMNPFQAALTAAIDLGGLTSVSELGPIAAPAMFERVICQAKRPKGAFDKSLAKAIDGMRREDLQRFIISTSTPARLAPVTTAIELARTIGLGSWYTRFEEVTGLKASTEFEPAELANQLYREHLLGQLI